MSFIRVSRHSVTTVVGLALAISLSMPAAGREIKAIQKDKRSGKIPVSDMLRSGLVGDKKVFDEYYAIVLELFQHPDNIRDLHKTRQDLAKDLSAAGNAPEKESHIRLRELLLAELPKIAEGKHDAPIRYNAMLLVAGLNLTEFQIGNKGIAIPLPEALPALLAAFDDAKQPDAVKVAAQIGILRHAQVEGGIAEKALATKVRESMLRLAAADKTPAGRSEEGHAWLRRGAAEILGALGPASDDADATRTVQALISLIDDTDASLGLRAEAASALGKLKLSKKEKADLVAIAQSLGKLAVNVVEKESSRRALKHYLLPVESALRGPSAVARPGEPAPTPTVGGIAALAADTPDKDFIEGLVAKFDTIMQVLNDDKLSDEDLAKKVVEEGQSLAKYLKLDSRRAAAADKAAEPARVVEK